jgi:hypothetical protein
MFSQSDPIIPKFPSRAAEEVYNQIQTQWVEEKSIDIRTRNARGTLLSFAGAELFSPEEKESLQARTVTHHKEASPHCDLLLKALRGDPSTPPPEMYTRFESLYREHFHPLNKETSS